MTRNASRVLVGFLVSPAVPALLLYVGESMFLAQRDVQQGATVIALFGYFAAVVLGVPAYFLLRFKNITGLSSYLLLGALIGLAAYTVYFVPGMVLNWKLRPENALLMLRNSLGFAALALGSGCIASLVFWRISIRSSKVAT